LPGRQPANPKIGASRSMRGYQLEAALLRVNELHAHSEPDSFPFAIYAPLVNQAVDDPHDD
ncbi:MAG: hypothetical protein ACLGG5_08525, partial [Thermoleophilia bacterium]